LFEQRMLVLAQLNDWMQMAPNPSSISSSRISPRETSKANRLHTRWITAFAELEITLGTLEVFQEFDKSRPWRRAFEVLEKSRTDSCARGFLVVRGSACLLLRSLLE
jgi:hypothetical protein